MNRIINSRISPLVFPSSSTSSSSWFLLLLLLLINGYLINQIQGLKDGECPSIKSNLNCDVINNITTTSTTSIECQMDEDCPGFDKCCSNGCSFTCSQSLVSGCEQTRRQARLLNTLEPNCDMNGNFEEIQCNGANAGDDDDLCWCVDVYGFELGGTRAKGREAVNCTKHNPICSAHQCRMLCPQGFEIDSNGCSICSCRDICRNINCPGGSRCEVIEIPCTNEPNCPPQPICREARSLDSICPFGKPLILPESGNPYLCGNGNGKPSCPPAFSCNIMDENDYGVCCARTNSLEKVGSCPVVTGVESNDDNCTTCKIDLQCPGVQKCCPSLSCGNSCAMPVNLTLCLQQRQLSELLTSKEDDKGYIPQCDENGHFVTKQCSKNGKICWCVDPEGKASVTGIGPANTVDCASSNIISNFEKSMLAQPRGLRKSGVTIESFNVNPCHVGTPLINATLGEVQTCSFKSNHDDDDDGVDNSNHDCPNSYTCIMVQVNSAGVCCLNQTLTEPTKPGMCPFLSSASLCHNNESKSCSSDKECEGDMKCCGLGSTCFGRAICADPLLMSSTEETIDNFSMCKYLNTIGKKSHGVLKKYKMGFGVPTCTEAGDFEPIQCANGENCWCVDKYGMMIGEIFSYNSSIMNSSSTICKSSGVEDTCLGMTCKLNCDYGYIKDPSNGCSLCECRHPCQDKDVLCGEDHICELVDIDCAHGQICPALPYCLPKSLIVPTCPSNKQPYIDPILQEKMTCNPRARMLQCPDDHFCHEVDDDLGLCCPVLEDDVIAQELVPNARGFNINADNSNSNNDNNNVDQQGAEDNLLEDTIVHTPEDYVNPIECPEDYVSNVVDCGFKCFNSSDCANGDSDSDNNNNNNMKCCANECGTSCIDVNAFPKSSCFLPKEIGFCKASLPKWYFNVESNTCEEFLYSGCDGNANRFSTKEKCENFCPQLTLCEQARELMKRQKVLALKTNSHKLIQVPECDASGSWKMSCIHEVGICWCVDKFGMTIKDTIGRKGSVSCSNLKRNNRKSRLLSMKVPRVCPENATIHVCDSNLCNNKICLSDPTATCRVNPCDSCSIEFYNFINGQLVDCSTNLTKCESEMQAVFNSKAFEIQRILAARELDMREFAEVYLQDSADDMPLQRGKRLRREIMISEEVNTCPQQPIQYLLNLLSGSCTDECTLDTDCESGHKCCLAECGLRCLPPVTTISPPIMVEPPQPIMMLVLPPQCRKDNGDYEQIQNQNGVEYCVNEKTGEPISSTITRGTISNCNTSSSSPYLSFEQQVCSNPGQTPMICRNECLHAKCISHPDAICVANPCDACSVTFYSPTGEKLNCQHKCSQPMQIGPCRASIRKYFYNQSSGKCEEFIYGGCQGNDNNFDHLADCEFECGANRDICTDPMRLILDQHDPPLSCENDNNATRYFYNTETSSCETTMDCRLGNFVSYEQCVTSCPRQVICPFIQDDGLLQICDRHEACDNVTFCMDHLEELICNVDPCTCKASLVDLNGNPLESCSTTFDDDEVKLSEDLPEQHLSSVEETQAQTRTGVIKEENSENSEETLKTTLRPESAQPTVIPTIMVDLENAKVIISTSMSSRDTDPEENLITTTEQEEIVQTTVPPLLPSAEVSQSNTERYEYVTLPGLTEPEVPESNPSQSKESDPKDVVKEETTTDKQPESENFPTTLRNNVNIEEILDSSNKDDKLNQNNIPDPEFITTTSFRTPSTKSSTYLSPPSIDEEKITTTQKAEQSDHFGQLHSIPFEQEQKPKASSPEDETPTTEIQVESQGVTAAPGNEIEKEEDSTTMNIGRSSLDKIQIPNVEIERSSGEIIIEDEKFPALAPTKDEREDNVITEEAVFSSTTIELSSIFFISITVLSTLLILTGFFFARRKKQINNHSTAQTKKFEPLEFNSFVQLQQQIEFTKQQNSSNNTNNCKNDSTNLVIPSDSYYEQLYH